MTLASVWGERGVPFRRDPQVTALYVSKGHQEALARLHLVVEQCELGLLTGEVGSGKSTLIRRLVHALDPLQYAPVYLAWANLKPRDFYGELLRHIGEEPQPLARAKRLWAERLNARVNQGDRQLVVLVDEAQELNEALLLELRFAMNHQMDARSLFSLILVGQPVLHRTLRLKKHEAIQQRVALSYHLNGFSEEETAAYIRHQMKQAGATVPLFTEGAIHLIYRVSQGIPRLINQICTHALYDASQRKEEVIEESHINRVLADQEQQRGVFG